MGNLPALPEFFSRQVGKARRFYLDIEASRRKPLTVVSAGLEHCAADYAIDRTTFPWSCIEYVVRGRGELELRGIRCKLKPGSVFSYGPGTAHRITTDRRDPLVKYFVDFAGTGAAQVLKASTLAAGGIMQVFPPDCASPLYEELIDCGLQARPGSSQLCAKLLECLALKIGAVSTQPEEAESSSFGTYLLCRTFIEQNFLTLRSLEQIARECSMDNGYICRLFRRFDHQSPYQFLLRLKINYAAGELQKQGARVKDVAAAVGFSDSFHFSRVFRGILGSSPSQFRRPH